MDYTRSSLLFQFKKVARYSRLYGPARTVVKVRGQLHMAGRGAPLLRSRLKAKPEAFVGILGCGNFAFANIAYYVTKERGAIIRGVMDSDRSRAESLARRYGAKYATDCANDVINDPDIGVVYIASNHASHAPYAVAALEQGKAVHIEKPHVVSWQQLRDLCASMERTSGRLALGFNRPESPIGSHIKTALESQSGPGMYNWFVAGHEIASDHWYFSAEEGGRVLGNLCHWTDFLYHLVPAEDRYPLTIRPTRAEQSDSNIAVTFTFGDGTIGIITFSAKGHTFEGVRETLSAHRGDLLLQMSDFKTLEMHVGSRITKHKGRFRDHGHKTRILRSLEMVNAEGGCSLGYVWETGELFLATKDALESQTDVTLEGFSAAQLAGPTAQRLS